MKLFNKFNSILFLGCVISILYSTAAFANDGIFASLLENNEILNAMPAKNTNPDIYVTCNNDANMKSDSSETSRQIKVLPTGYNLTVLGTEYGWVNVMDDQGQTGYVYSADVTFKNGKKPVNIDPIVKKGNEIVSFSKQYLGTPYVWGGTSLTSGVDCSGFVYSVYKNFGITLNRSSRGMYSSNGVSVNKSELKPGDLLFFNTGGNGVSHVGMYIGNSQYIHAASVNVKISNLNDSYSTRTYVGAKRVLA